MPIVTCTLLVAFAAVYACEVMLRLDAKGVLLPIDVATLSALGGLNWASVVTQGQWLRIFSATFLHADPLHLVFNGSVLLVAGRTMERVLGPAWFGAVYALSAITGSMASLLINSTTTLSVGASGAIMGVVAAAFVTSFHFPAGRTRKQLENLAFSVLIPSLLPLAISLSPGTVDFAAHLGGALGGAAISLALIRIWPATDPTPELRPVAHAICAVALVGALLSVGSIVGGYAEETLR